MKANEIREAFLDFFKSKEHHIVPSAPMVVKDDPTLMFTNAGMNQFKDIFLGNSPITINRVANSQKCLRVSGKHNDLEEVGHDTYHHTMFEMLGNWSFGNYFKKEAIQWAWEFLTTTLGMDKSRLYVTVFEGSKEDELDWDEEAFNIWAEYIDKNKIIKGAKKDNFWEMGDTGPCGPCSEIHVDLRDDKERVKVDGGELVNKDNPGVIEIWNLVFIQFNRKSNGQLEMLSKKHVDTGMGFERLCMVIQGKKSNYDTDIFQPIIHELSRYTGFKYGDKEKTDIAMRVVADHLRAVSFAIADGQLPSNNKAGYVIRRILRRASRYAFTFLKQETPFIYSLVDILVDQMGQHFPGLKNQRDLVQNVIKEEESAFLRTLDTGIKRLTDVMDKLKMSGQRIIDGKTAFELYDTFGFPLDLTELIARENDMAINHADFEKEMANQKIRSKADAATSTEDWVILQEQEKEEFVGYDSLSAEVSITRYRKVTSKGKDLYHLVFDKTPFYAESGGQVGDIGYIQQDEEKISIMNTLNENNLCIHVTKELPRDPQLVFTAIVNTRKRQDAANNHTATHLMHYALKKVLGNHVEQKGSLVHPDYLRFDFSHFSKVSDEELEQVEELVNKKIRQNIILEEKRNIPIDEAKNMGAVALFGEKYGEQVRVIRFGDSTELCGGTHVSATGEIGLFKITGESSVSAGVRRIEAITGETAYQHVSSKLKLLEQVNEKFLNPRDLLQSIDNLFEEKEELVKIVEGFEKEQVKLIKQQLKEKLEQKDNINIIAQEVNINSASAIKDLAFQMKGEVDNLFLILGANVGGKPNLTIMISDNLVKDRKLHAGKIIKEVAKEIQGGGGGQPFYATAGGKNLEGMTNAIKKALEYL